MRRILPWPLAATLLLAACATSPAYRPSVVAVPPAFRESPADTRDHPHAAAAPAAGAGTRVVPVVPRRAGASGAVTRRLLARPGRHDARPPDGGAAARQPGRAGRRGAASRGARAARAERAARPRADRHRRGRLHPPAALERDVPDRQRHLPRPGHLGRRLRRVLGAGSVRAGAPERAGAGRAGRCRGGGPAGRAGGAHGGAGADLLRAARRAGAAGGGAAERARTSGGRWR